ncbi:MAG: pyruvate dehydrogenase [Candidatus Thorarchaeota archaeon]|jgi:hypothetical protein
MSSEEPYSSEEDEDVWKDNADWEEEEWGDEWEESDHDW